MKKLTRSMMEWHTASINFDIRIAVNKIGGVDRSVNLDRRLKINTQQKIQKKAQYIFLAAPNWKLMYKLIESRKNYFAAEPVLICVTERKCSIFWAKYSRGIISPSAIVRVIRQKVALNKSIRILLGCLVARPVLAVDLSDLIMISRGRVGYLEKAALNFINEPIVSDFDALWACSLGDVRSMTIFDIESASDNLSRICLGSNFYFCALPARGLREAFFCAFISDV